MTGKEERDYKEKFVRTIEGKMNRKTAAESDSYLWMRVFGIIGWSVVVPLVLGVALGMWIDKTVHLKVSFTLMLLLLGVILGCLNAWNSLKDMMKR